MELWIRSQNREELRKVKEIYIATRDIYQIRADYLPELYENSGDSYTLLGEYKTKERALEVLDEIQEILFPKVEYNPKSKIDESLVIGWECNLPLITSNGTSVVQPLNNYVYEMPKE